MIPPRSTITYQPTRRRVISFRTTGYSPRTFIAEMREKTREKRLWPDQGLNVTIGYEQKISLPGRANGLEWR
ncbi:hypothetical protein N7444_012343 [Penicillium canescens]|nr:hypothetical protein N7444_012343 [Penicillium canescens]